ncbi:MAG: hypothetical protein ILO42_03805, partial [Clostridia bacterium]|nr:hypothetical protein [Clostridia bacterium]
MKTRVLVFAVILCLALGLFWFASCGSQTGTDVTEPDTGASTTAPVVTEHVHTPEDKETIDLEPSCASAGSKSKHCSVCKEIIPETVEEIPALAHTPGQTYKVLEAATCAAAGREVCVCEICGQAIDGTEREIPIDETAHRILEWTVTENVSLLHQKGSRSGTCEVCHKNFVEEMVYEPNIIVFTPFDDKYKEDTVYFNEIQGGKHFYSTMSDPDGNDLYVEFSILWNESIINFDGNANGYIFGHMDGKPLWYQTPVPGIKTSDSQFPGSFEWTSKFSVPVSDGEVSTPAGMCGKSDNFFDYPNIAGPDQENPEYGWHRVGFRYHVDLLEGKTGEELTDYMATVTCYVDGVAIFKLNTGTEGLPNWGSALFKAEPDGNGGIKYSDVDNWLIPFAINHATTKAEAFVYFAIDDISVTCGKGFAMPVQKVANPEAVKITVDEGVEITATVHFQSA